MATDASSHNYAHRPAELPRQPGDRHPAPLAVLLDVQRAASATFSCRSSSNGAPLHREHTLRLRGRVRGRVRLVRGDDAVSAGGDVRKYLIICAPPYLKPYL
jgi:hypothetical protein